MSIYDRTALQATDVSPQQQELLVRLMEECGEVIQAASKTLRWGWESRNPHDMTLGTNEEQLIREFNAIVRLYMRLMRVEHLDATLKDGQLRVVENR